MKNPIGQQFLLGESSDSRTQNTKCEKCQTDYLYRTDSERPDLKGDLAKGVVPCPRCGWVQQDMVKSSRRSKSFKVSAATALVFGAAGIASGSGILLGAGLGVSLLAGFVAKSAHNPNGKFDEEKSAELAKRSSGVALPELDQESGVTEQALQRELFACLRKAMLSMAGIDGDIDPSEIMAISRLYVEHTNQRVDTATLEHEAKRAIGKHHRMLNGLHCLAPYLQADDKTQFLKVAAIVAAADGRIDTKERELMHSMAETLSVPVAEVDCLLASQTN